MAIPATDIWLYLALAKDIATGTGALADPSTMPNMKMPPVLCPVSVQSCHEESEEAKKVGLILILLSINMRAKGDSCTLELKVMPTWWLHQMWSSRCQPSMVRRS